MIDRDVYIPNRTVENFLESLKAKLSKEYSPVKVYISTANPYNHWLRNVYNIYNNTELME